MVKAGKFSAPADGAGAGEGACAAAGGNEAEELESLLDPVISVEFVSVEAVLEVVVPEEVAVAEEAGAAGVAVEVELEVVLEDELEVGAGATGTGADEMITGAGACASGAVVVGVCVDDCPDDSTHQ
jgi:hypothetical protein